MKCLMSHVWSVESCLVSDHVFGVMFCFWSCSMMSCLVSDRVFGVMSCFRMTIHVSGWLIIVLWCHAFHFFYRMLLKSMDLCLRCDQCFTFWPLSSLLILTLKITWLEMSHDLRGHMTFLVTLFDWFILKSFFIEMMIFDKSFLWLTV